MSNIYIAEKEQLDNQNTLLSTYNTTLQHIEEDLSDIATLVEQKQIKTVTPTKQKQIIEADEGYNSLASVIVNPSPSPDIIDKTITQNGIYKASEEMPPVDGYRQIEVDVPEPALEHGSATPKTTAETYTPQGDGFSEFTVEATPLEAKTVIPTSQQQVVTPTAPNIGLSSVTVGAAPPPTLITKQISANGTYAAADDNADGYSEVTVDVQPFFSDNGTMYFADMVIPNTVTSIKNNAYTSCIDMKSILIPNSVLTIGSWAFASSGLTKITFPDTISTLSINVLFNCSYLSLVVIPKSVNTIQNNAIYRGNSNRTIDLSDYLNPNSLPSLASPASAMAETYLVANQEMLEAFEAATNWSAHAGKYVIKGATP